MATSLTARDILTMTSEDLRKYVSDLGQDPKSMSKTDMQTSKLKAALFNAYSVVSEVHRSRFRNRMKQPTETNSDFAFVLGIHC